METVKEGGRQADGRSYRARSLGYYARFGSMVLDLEDVTAVGLSAVGVGVDVDFETRVDAATTCCVCAGLGGAGRNRAGLSGAGLLNFKGPIVQYYSPMGI